MIYGTNHKRGNLHHSSCHSKICTSNYLNTLIDSLAIYAFIAPLANIYGSTLDNYMLHVVKSVFV